MRSLKAASWPSHFLGHDSWPPSSYGDWPLQILSGGTVGYEDAVVISFSGTSDESVRPVIESTARSVVAYMAYNSMALNPERTQLLWIGSGLSSPDIMVGNTLISQVEMIDFPGLKFGRNLKSDISLLIYGINSLAGGCKMPPGSPSDKVCSWCCEGPPLVVALQRLSSPIWAWMILCWPWL